MLYSNHFFFKTINYRCATMILFGAPTHVEKEREKGTSGIKSYPWAIA